MKPEIHPQYQDATITCACGASYPTRSTAGSFGVDICAACHPFYTGRQKIMDTAGRVERFRRKYARAAEKAKKGGRSSAAAEKAAQAKAAGEEESASE